MKLHRTGAYRNRGTSLLISDDLAKRTKWSAPSWNAVVGEVDFSVSGNDRGARYHYDVTLTAPDLLALVSCALPKLDAPARAVAAGAIATLQELLVFNQPAQQAKVAA